MKTFSTILFCAALMAVTCSVSAQISEFRTYRVTAVKTGSANITSESNYAEVAPELRIFVPNTFTPNEDGLNDMFGPKGEGIAWIDMQIFDRWGNLIFHTNNPKQWWNGKYHKEDAPMGAYVYKILARGTYEGSASFSGTVTLLR
jgi:gliding motility-associated-like protein